MSSVWWDRRDLMRSKRRGNKTEARWACLGRPPWVAARRRFPMTSAGVRLPGGLGGGPMVRDIGSWSCHGGSSLESVSLSGCLGRGGETWPSPRLRLEMQLNRWRHRMRHSHQCWTVLGPTFLGGLRSGGLRSGVLAERSIGQGPSEGVGRLYLRVTDAAWPWPYLPRTTLVLVSCTMDSRTEISFVHVHTWDVLP